jgi:uncharacterized protein DUF4331
MSHHYSGPDLAFPHGDARVDLCDLFAFPKPQDTSKSILIMDVHPSIGWDPPGPTPAEPFAPEAIYELKIDTDRDAVADIAFRVRFSPSENGAQSATVRRAEGADAAGMGDGGEAIIEGAPVSMGREAQVAQAGDYRFFAGWRSDPFFADLEGALNDLQFTATTSSPTKTCAASRWRFLIVTWELPGSVSGTERWSLRMTRAGSRQTGGLGARSPFSSVRARKEPRISGVSRRMTPASWTASPTRWSTQVGTRRRRPSG